MDDRYYDPALQEFDARNVLWPSWCELKNPPVQYSQDEIAQFERHFSSIHPSVVEEYRERIRQPDYRTAYRRLKSRTIAWASGMDESAEESALLLDDIEQGRKQRAFVPNELQTAILAELNGKAMSGAELLTALNCGSKETLYGKNGRGGLTELNKLGIVKNKRRLGYYRPDAPPQK